MTKDMPSLIDEEKLGDTAQCLIGGTSNGPVQKIETSITNIGIEIRNDRGQMLESLTWVELEDMKKKVGPANFLHIEGHVGQDILIRYAFQAFVDFCNKLPEIPGLEEIKVEMLQDSKIDLNTRAILEAISRYERSEKNEEWRVAFSRFFKYIAFLYRFDDVMRGRIGWFLWWFIVKNGNFCWLMSTEFDPQNWKPVRNEEMMARIVGPCLMEPGRLYPPPEVQRALEAGEVWGGRVQNIED